MHKLITQLFAKRGINSVDELSKEERVTFDQFDKEYKAILALEDNLNVGHIETFCRAQIEVIESKWADLNLPNERKAELIAHHTVYSTLLKVISAPKVAREAYEKKLKYYLEK